LDYFIEKIAYSSHKMEWQQHNNNTEQLIALHRFRYDIIRYTTLTFRVTSPPQSNARHSLVH